jgi:hypothetical protein
MKATMPVYRISAVSLLIGGDIGSARPRRFSAPRRNAEAVSATARAIPLGPVHRGSLRSLAAISRFHASTPTAAKQQDP